MKFVTSTTSHRAVPAAAPKEAEKVGPPMTQEEAKSKIVQMRPVPAPTPETEAARPAGPTPPPARPAILQMHPEKAEEPVEKALDKENEYVALNLTRSASAFIYKMLEAPGELPDKPYRAPHARAAKEVVSLSDWFMGPTGTGNPKLIRIEHAIIQGTPGTRWETKGAAVEMKRKYVQRLKEMCVAHRDAGLLVHNCRGYQELLAALNGEPFSIEKDVER